MSTYMDIISQEFPSIDEDLFEYVNSVLGNGAEDFSNSEDLYEAVGELLNELDDKHEDDIREICGRIHSFMFGDAKGSSNGPVKILGAPVHLATLVSKNTKQKHEEHKSIWLAQKENASTVDQKKLEKAEAKIKQKQDKRDELDSQPIKKILSTGEATASQQSSRKENKMEASGTNKTCDIRIENFDVAFGELTLLVNADLMLSYGRRYGFVGRNGLGKTTLLKMIAKGNLRIPTHISILHVEQEVVGDDTLALQSVLECDEKREGLLKEEQQITAKLQSSSPDGTDCSSRLGEIYRELEAIEADKAPAKAGMILAGLGFTPRMQRMKTREFSGGWRMRLALARALFTKPDLLLLDEPTNMLDMKAIIWLENYLQTWVSTILVVSHDRSFLNAVSTDVLHLHTQRLDAYKGDFEMFVKVRGDRLKSQQKEYEAQKEYRDHIQRFIDRFRYNANRASQVQSKLKHLEKLPELKPVEKETEVVWKFPEAEKLSPPILQLDELEFYYTKDKPIFTNVCVSASMDSRICIVGENGAGKTTLLKILLGDLSPINGVRHVHRNLRIGYFTQHHVDQLDLTGSSVDLLAARFPGKPSEQYRQQLGKFGVTGDLALRPVVSLSGGQKSRVAFAAICMANPNFFILDEPTNHLDMETIEALGKAISQFQGGVILVSHDERLIRVVCKELWVCSNGTISALDGGFDEYRKIVEAELAAES